MTINGFTTKGKERELQTRKEQAKGRKATTAKTLVKTLVAEQAKGRNAAKVSARKQEKALKDYYAKEGLKSVKELAIENGTGWRATSIPTDHWRKRPELIVRDDPNVVLPKPVQAAVNVANAYFEPHTKLTFEVEVPRLFTVGCGDNTLSRITDGISDTIKVILAQHALRPLPNSRITIEGVNVPQLKQKEVTNGE